MMGVVVGDLRLAARRLLKSPGFAVAVVVLMALGIAANTAVFSLANAVLLRTLPVPEADRLVLLALDNPDGSSQYMLPQDVYRRLRDENDVLQSFAAATFPPITLAGDGRAERVDGLLVSGTFFETLGVEAVLGRVLTAADERQPVCVISYALWQRRFTGDPAVIGRTVQVNAHPFTVVGVTPQEFTGLSEEVRLDITIPLRAVGMEEYFSFPVRTFGRLQPGLGANQAQASLDAVYRRIAAETSPDGLSDARVSLATGQQGFSNLRTRYERPLLLLMAMVAAVLLIACANVANLFLARLSRRTKEIATRRALGAGRVGAVRELLAENALLTLVGAGLGLVLAYWATSALLALAPRQAGGGALLVDANPDWRVLLFTLAATIIVGLVGGLAPILKSGRADLVPVLKGASGLRAAGSFSHNGVLAALQVALSLVLLISAGLFARSLQNLQSVELGLSPEQLVLLTLDPGTSGYTASASNELAQRLVERAEGTPGVASVSVGFISPLSGGFAVTEVRGPNDPLDESAWLAVNWIGTDYFRVLATPLVAGREFSPADGRRNQAAMVNQKAASSFWPGENPIGKSLHIGGAEGVEYEIVGVAADAKWNSIRGDAEAAVYLPFAENTRPHFVLHVRAAGGTTPVIAALTGELRTLAADVPPLDVTTMTAQLDRKLTLDRLMAVLTVLFGALAAFVAVIGLYSVMGFAVATRTREIGIRMALGADRRRVLNEVIREGALLIAAGLALGLPCALWASRFAASFLYGLDAADPVTYIVLSLALAVTALGAAWLPARRAAKVDPLIALKSE